MAETGSTQRVGARPLLVLASILAIVAGVAAMSALLVGRAVNERLPMDVGAFRGVADAQDVASTVAELDGVDSVSIETVSGDTFVPVLGLVIARTKEPWNQSDVERLAASLQDRAAGFNPRRPVHVAIATPEAFIAVSGDAEENAARIDIAARALAAGASAVHVAPQNFDVAEWSPQSVSGPSLVTVVLRPGMDPHELQAALGPKVKIADHVRWVTTSAT